MGSVRPSGRRLMNGEPDSKPAPLIPDGPTGLRRAKRTGTGSKPAPVKASEVAPTRPPGRRERLNQFWQRRRRLFWALHSAWALAGGIVVIILAREQYGFVPWVVLFLGLTWLSTLYFGRSVATASDGGESRAAGAARKATSYVTRAMFQETLFFLLPFYAYSTVIGSANVVFVALLAILAILSCLDLAFDRWLRESRIFSLLFFALVAFAGTNLLLPLLLPIEPTTATQIAATVAMASALPLALGATRPSRGQIALLTLTTAAFLAVAIGFPRVVPPVPLRLQSIEFASGIDRANLQLEAELTASVRSADVANGLYVRMQVFAPVVMPTLVKVRWERDGKELRVSRDIEITAHKQGFRVWDAWRPASDTVTPGRYTVFLETRERRAFGSATIIVTP
jgi:hypothetical protein